MADLAAASSARLKDHMAGGIDTTSLPQGGSAGALGGMGSLQRAEARPDLVENIANAGQIRRTYGTDFSEDRRRVEDALMSRMNPQLERDQEALRARLVGQGIREGSEAYDRAMNRFGEQSNDARMQAILAGGQEQSRLVGLEADRAGFENAAQAQQYGQNANDAEFMNSARSNEFGMELSGKGFNNDAELQEFNRSLAANQYADQKRSGVLQEQFAIRNQPINEIGALLGTGQVTQPNFVNAQIGGIAGTDRAGLEMSAYNSKLDAWKQQAAGRSSLMGGILGAGGQLGAAALMSDRRVKSDIRRIGRSGRLPVYEFRYVGSDQRHVGFMAQDVLKVDPGAVVFLESGLMAVDYDKAREAAG
ncbi:tail fiber domain-containing protein [Tritonibacter mobilis]|nr:tail fiber domain-containing protein [Tritonibacter mobilis]